MGSGRLAGGEPRSTHSVIDGLDTWLLLGTELPSDKVSSRWIFLIGDASWGDFEVSFVSEGEDESADVSLFELAGRSFGCMGIFSGKCPISW